MLVIPNLIISSLLVVIITGLCIFHGVFLKIMPFDFKKNKNRFLFFFFAYFGLLVFTSIWGFSFYLLNLFWDIVICLNFQFMFLFFLFCVIFSIVFCISFIEAMNYQFTFHSYWKDENYFCFLISKIFGCFFLLFSISLPSIAYYILDNFFAATVSHGIVIGFSLLYFFWFFFFFYHVIFESSFFLD